ncbi:MAG TPA: TolC family protein [Vicinamibacterales bacterium]|nr:TolC family protein [Vicinamibacterales bacterium]
MFGRVSVTGLSFLLTAGAAGGALSAQEAAPVAQIPLAPVPARVGVTSVAEPLELQRAVEMALENNPDIIVARLDRAGATFQVAAARGAYDLNLTSNSFAEHNVSPVASIIGGGANGQLTQNTVTANAGARGLTPWGGGSFQVDFSSTRFDSENQFVTLNPQFPTSFRASYAQPLGRGLTFDAPRRQIEIARRTETLSLAGFRERALDVVTRVEQAYWNLAFALRNYDTQQQALTQARSQVESNRRMADAGVLAPIAVVEARTQAATFEQAVYAAQDAVTRTENALKELILPDRSSPLWSRALQPVTPAEPPSGEREEDATVRQALANRPEILRQETAAAIADIEVRYFKDQTRPQLDLVGTYAVSGLAGRVISAGPNPITAGTLVLQDRINELSGLAGLPALPPPATGTGVQDFLVGGYGQSVSNLFEGNFPTARIDLRLQLPLRNRTAEANLGLARLQQQEVRAERVRVEQAIEAEVRDALQTVRSTRGRLAAAAEARASAQEQYESEQRQFEAGTSTVFLVLQRQTALVTAQAREIQAETDLQSALAFLRNATGEGLARWNIQLESQAPPKPRR